MDIKTEGRNTRNGRIKEDWSGGQGDVREAEEEDQPKQRMMRKHKEICCFVTIKSKQYCEGFFFLL